MTTNNCACRQQRTSHVWNSSSTVLVTIAVATSLLLCLITTESFVPSSTKTSFVVNVNNRQQKQQQHHEKPLSSTVLFLAGMSRKAEKMDEEREEQTSGRLLKAMAEMEGGNDDDDDDDAIELPPEDSSSADDISFLKKVQQIEEEAEMELMQQEAMERQKQMEEAAADASSAGVESDVATESVVGGAESPSDNISVDKRPEVSQFNVKVKMQDGTTQTIPYIQGTKVMDIITRNAVKLSELGPMYRLAQMFPGVPPDIREKYRIDDEKYWNLEIKLPEIIDEFKKVAYIKTDDGTMELPRHPCVRNAAIDWATANRDLLGYEFQLALSKLTCRAAWQNDYEKVKEYRGLCIHFITIEKYLAGPFRQCMLDAEERNGPNFGNLNLTQYCGTELYERTADYLVLKSIVEHWVNKLKDAEKIEAIDPTPENMQELLFIGDPKRYLPESQVIWRKDDCQKIAAMALKMCNLFVETPELFDDLPVEVRFLERVSKLPLNLGFETDAKGEKAKLKIVGGTAVRKFVLEEFCPSENIDPYSLREGIRRLYENFNNMQIDPYGDITDRIKLIIDTMAEGTNEASQPTDEYVHDYGDPESPGYFETYTHNFPFESRIRFLDSFLDDEPDPEDAWKPEQLQRSAQKFGDQAATLGKGLFDFSDAIPDFGEMAEELPFIGDSIREDRDRERAERFEQERDDVDEDGYRKETNYTYTPPYSRALGRPREDQPGGGWWKLMDEASLESYLKDGLVDEETVEKARAEGRKPFIKSYEPGYIINDDGSKQP